jgi:import receptor subunit TOM70
VLSGLVRPPLSFGYMECADRIDPKPTLPANPTQGDQTLLLAFDALSAADYSHAVSFVNESIDQGISFKEGQAEAYNLRATFKYVLPLQMKK